MPAKDQVKKAVWIFSRKEEKEPQARPDDQNKVDDFVAEKEGEEESNTAKFMRGFKKALGD